VRQRGVGGVEQALVVDGDHPVPFVDVRADHGAEEHQARIVDQGVEASEPGDRLPYGGHGLGAVGDVSFHDERGAAYLLDLGREGLQAVAASSHERDDGVLAGELAGDGRADPAARPGHEGDGAVQSACHAIAASSRARLVDTSR